MAPRIVVALSSAGNPDFRQDPSRALPGVPRKRVPVASLCEAAAACRAYIEAHDLGGGNWTGGQVFVGKIQIAEVSYNGRVWTPFPFGWPQRVEIEGGDLDASPPPAWLMPLGWLDTPIVGKVVRVDADRVGQYLGVLANEEDGRPYHYFVNGAINGTPQACWGFPAMVGTAITDKRTPTEAIMTALGARP
jgi:hypothetical protein